MEIIINTKTKKDRKKMLSDYLKSNKCGELDDDETKHFRQIFSKHYTPDNGEDKFNPFSISKVSIKIDNWNKKYFSIQVNNIWYPTSIQRLSGGNKNESLIFSRALRSDINEQIKIFRNTNPLNPNNICPIMNKPLNLDAEVDHIIPFHKLKDDWLYNEKMYSCSYNFDLMDYTLNEPYRKKWQDYHLNNAKLRWVSKEGNKIAHIQI